MKLNKIQYDNLIYLSSVIELSDETIDIILELSKVLFDESPCSTCPEQLREAYGKLIDAIDTIEVVDDAPKTQDISNRELLFLLMETKDSSTANQVKKIYESEVGHRITVGCFCKQNNIEKLYNIVREYLDGKNG